MKTSSIVVALLASTLVTVQAQNAGTQTGANQPKNAPPQLPPPTPHRVVERGANHRVWQWETYERSPQGKTTPQVHRITELAAGLHYWQNNQWLESKAQINLLPAGSAAAAAAVQGQHQAYFPGDIYQGAIEVVTAEGLHLKSRPVGLIYDDGTHTVLIAALTNSVGQLASSNQIIYPNAFSGGAADLLLVYRRGGFESEVVFREQLAAPEAWGMDAASTRLELLTEFFNPAEPVQTVSATDAFDGLADTSLQFGSLLMTRGKAFMAGTPDNAVEPAEAAPDKPAIRVYKSWLQLQQRTFLIEMVPYRRIAAALQMLPAQAVVTPAPNKMFAADWLPPRRPIEAATNSITLARNDVLQQPGVVLDYIAVTTSQSDFTFQGDATYYISSGVTLSGTTVIEGATIVKYGSGGTITVTGPYVCQTGPYRPAIFTSMNDDAVGETISGSSHNPGSQDSTLDLDISSTGGKLKHVRFSYTSGGAAQQGLEVWDSQFINCNDYALRELGQTAVVHNVLFANCGVCVSQDSSNPTLAGEHITGDQCGALMNSSGSAYLTNCLFTALGSSLPSPAATAPTVVSCSSRSGVYQTVGGGDYYLAGDTYRNYGTYDIDPLVLADIATKTTYSPTVFPTGTVTPQVLTNRPIRDTDQPDLGYHYDVLDDVFGGCDLYGTLTLSPGTAVAWYEDYGNAYSSGQPYGLSLNDGALFSSQGTAGDPCAVVRFEMVQESCNGNWGNRGWMCGLMLNGSGPGTSAPQLRANFTKWASYWGVAGFFRDNWAYGEVHVANSEFYSSMLGGYGVSQYFTNCLFARTCLAYWDQLDAPSLAFLNCTFYNGAMALCRYNGQSSSFWNIKNTVFDGTAILTADDLGGAGDSTAFDYNAYNSANTVWQDYDFGVGVPCAGALENPGAHDVTVANGYRWQAGLLGDFYLPPDSPLTNNGSGYAADLAIGLDNATTQTNQAPDTGRVDIGYHYPISGYIRDGLLAYWKLNDGHGASAQDSVGTNNLILTNSPTWGPGYLSLNGSSQYCYAKNSDALDITGKITICAWVNSSSFPAIDQAEVPVEKGYDGAAEGYFIRYSYYPTNHVYRGINLEAGSYYPDIQFGNSVTNLNLVGQWYFLASVYDNTNWILYVNGLEANTQGGGPAAQGPQHTAAPLYVGAAKIINSDERYFAGSIHDVGIYNRALSADEIRVNFLNTKTNSSVAIPDLLYYKMTDEEALQTNKYDIVLSDYSTSGGHTGNGVCDSGNIGNTNRQYWLWYTNKVGLTNALHFNGQSTIVTVTNSATAFNFTTNAFALNLWVSMEHSQDGHLFQNGGITNGWYIKVGGDRIYFGSAIPGLVSTIGTVDVVMGDEVWNMVTGVWDGTNGSIYINGLKVQTSGNFSTPARSAYNLVSGVDFPPGTNYLDGQIWSPQIWGSKLSAVDIANLYFQQIKGVPWP